ncbi:TetR/AcrR family transcriptional regulator [Allobranchiibius sp. CTAmp26]|uniref:TetR/AcrR family transcriptional regulator n=1 Tax=Allobranchiibius sp. CTAmp26 TaxID=2815214 RepID=UPI001AA16334|nr:TetR/AcrR family transcriptional regulator [Allobranchiibius sp. CTAmp26]MBO1756142.1 TetR/AcrR family transcriptional regulator [Allobranchiibius sp. CTAmp26]
MPPRSAPDLDVRRGQLTRAARDIAESEGWAAVTMRRIATEIGVTQPVLYSAFPAGRQALLDAVAVGGFDEMATRLEAVDSEPMARMQAYLDFATTRPHVYEAMFSMPTGLPFGVGDGPAPLHRAFAAIQIAFPGPDDTRAEVAWATLHGLATLLVSGRLPASRAQARLECAHWALTAD